MQLEYIHYSKEPFRLKKRKYQQKSDYKPTGLWFSVEGYSDDQTWETWCRSEDFAIENLAHKTHIAIVPDAKILVLDSVEKTALFGHQYLCGDNPLSQAMGRRFTIWIDWQRVASDYDGIVIAPYFWELRHDNDFEWYYPWDCASGCVWNLEVITLKHTLLALLKKELKRNGEGLGDIEFESQPKSKMNSLYVAATGEFVYFFDKVSDGIGLSNKCVSESKY